MSDTLITTLINTPSESVFLETYTYKTADYTVTTLDRFVECNGTFNITFQTAVGNTHTWCIKNSGTGVITLLTTSSQTIDGQASGYWTLASGDSVVIKSNGANLLRGF